MGRAAGMTRRLASGEAGAACQISLVPLSRWRGSRDLGLVWLGYAFNTAALQLAWVVYGVGASEAMSGLGETALGEGKDFGWADGEHEHGPDLVSKAILTDLVLPSPVPLLRPGNGEAVQLL